MSSFLSNKFTARLGPVVIVAVIYYLVARFSLLLALEATNATAVWPPAGIGLAAILLLGYRLWPAIALGAFFANLDILTALGFTTSLAVAGSFSTAIGNTLEALVGGFLILHFTGGCNPFRRSSDIVKFVLFGALLGTTVSAITGTSTLCILKGTWSNFGLTWLTWWTGDAAGILVITPVIMTWYNRRKSGWTYLEISEAAVILALLAMLGWIVFVKEFTFPFFFIPLIFWAAFRFGQFESSVFILILSSLLIAGAVHGVILFNGATFNVSILLLQGYIGIVSVTTMLLTSLINERIAMLTDLNSNNEALRHEIDERQRTEEDLRRMNERFSLATNAACLGVWDWDMRKNELVWDDRMFELYGIKKGDLAGIYEAWLKGAHPDYPAGVDDIPKPAQAGEQEYDSEFRVEWPDGTTHFIQAYGKILRDADGRPVRMTGINFDITKRKRMEEEFGRLNEELEQRVKERTAELEKKNAELERMNRLFVGRELRMVELKKRVKKLEEKHGR